MPTTPSYRADIDGLRAVAVLLVVLYHFGFTQVPGGFVGVDVFFVISGYLITTIISKEMLEDRFSIAAFYSRRIRRILPALLSVVAASFVAGYFILMPGDYQSMGWQATTAVLGVSNFYFLRNTGYFDQAADLLPLLHTWSLGVEEQFYLLWPILLAIIVRFSPKSPRPVIVALLAIMAISFTAACLGVAENPQATFFLPHARAWELALGALLVFAPKLTARWAQVSSALGLMLIAGSALTLTSGDPFPGINALPPCLGAALVVWPGLQTSIAARLLSFEPLRQIGLASYSIYLWHWPLVVFYRHYNLGDMPTESIAALLLIVSVGLGFLSLRFIERPFRTMRLPSFRTIVTGGAGSSVVAASGFALAAADGLPMRLDSKFRAMESREVMWSWPCNLAALEGLDKKVCIFGADWETSTDRMFLWGDSHAVHFSPIMNTVLTPRQSVALYIGCPASMGGSYHRNRVDIPSYRDRCIDTRVDVLDFLQANPDVKTVVLAGMWEADYLTKDDDTQSRFGPTNFYNALSETLDAIRAPDRKILLVSNFARYTFDPTGCVFATSSLWRTSCPADALTLSKEVYDEQTAELDKVFTRLEEERNDVTVIFPGANMCASGVCQTEINGEFLYRDDNHIRRNLSWATLSEIARTIDLANAFDRR